MAQLVKNCLSMREMQETRVRALGREDPPKKGMATHSRILAYRIPWTGEPGRLQFMSLQRDAHDWVHAQAWKTNKQKKYECTIVPTPIVEKTILFFYWIALAPLSKINWQFYVWVFWASQVALVVKCVGSLGGWNTLEEDLTTHSSILAWRIPLTEELGRLWSIGLQRVGHNWSYLACTHALLF